jgi:hypothetical protein
MELKLAKLPDRTPVRIAITVSAELGRRLRAYTELYNALYQSGSETIADLVPYMLEHFLDNDRGFQKASKRAAPSKNQEGQ